MLQSYIFVTFFVCLALGQYLGSSQNDITALKYALTLENLEAAYYTQGMTNFTAANFTQAGYSPDVYMYLMMIMNHEIAHVTTLTQIITSLGGTPVQCTYNFSFPNVTAFVQLAKVLENVGVTAYDGVISTLTSGNLQCAAATIATVEARHAAYLNNLTGNVPFPTAFDNATTPDMIVVTIQPYIVNCSSAIQLPVAPPTANGTIISGDFNSTQNDLRALNYALTLEYLESAYYALGLSKFNATDFQNAGYNSSVYYYFTLIGQHELAHVSTIQSAITMLGGTPVEACIYNFTAALTNVSTFVASAQAFENVGVRAYDGAINSFSNGMLQTVAATIATVEARHAAYLNLLVGMSPFPYSFDNCTDPTVVVGIVSSYMTSCPGPALVLPVVPLFRQTPPVSVVQDLFISAELNDITALNYALTLENLEYSFYAQALSMFTMSNFTDAGYDNETYWYITMVMLHENAHVQTLQTAIKGLGGSPVPFCTYNFSLPNVTAFIQLAKVFENVGVTAYDGAISSISAGNLQTVAATIATVEARHAAYLNNLTGAIPFPTYLDNATMPQMIAATISPFLVQCSYSIELPAMPPASNETIVTGNFSSTQNDINVLNYALTLENLESAYYTMALAKFNATDFQNAGYNSSVYYYFTLIQQHEMAHVALLNRTIGAMGGMQAQPCTYNFTAALANVSTFVAFANVFENVGVRAYDGVISYITNGILETVAATIATVEARHAAYLSQLVGVSPFPYSFDNATAPADIVQTISPYLVWCPSTLVLPVDPAYRQNYTIYNETVSSMPSPSMPSSMPSSSMPSTSMPTGSMPSSSMPSSSMPSSSMPSSSMPSSSMPSSSMPSSSMPSSSMPSSSTPSTSVPSQANQSSSAVNLYSTCFTLVLLVIMILL